MTLRQFCSSLCLCVFLLVGCGGDGRPDLVPIMGTVTLNGEPLEGATIGFQPQDTEFKRPSTAKSDALGTFTVGTFGADDGIPVGTYRVTVKKTEMMGEIPEGFNTEEPEANARPMRVKWIVPMMYSDPEESGLTAEVTPDGMVPATFALEGDPEIVSTGRGRGEP